MKASKIETSTPIVRSVCLAWASNWGSAHLVAAAGEQLGVVGAPAEVGHWEGVPRQPQQQPRFPVQPDAPDDGRQVLGGRGQPVATVRELDVPYLVRVLVQSLQVGQLQQRLVGMHHRAYRAFGWP